MESKIIQWLRNARKIARHLLDVREEDVPAELDAFPELSTPEYYIRKAAQKEALDRKYGWDAFVASQRRARARRRMRIAGYAASAAVLVTAGTMLYLRLSDASPTPVTAELDPGTPRATLITGQGEEIVLTGYYVGTATGDGTVITTPEEGRLAYEATGAESDEPLRHTLRTPRGGEYSLELPDGTRIWLNSETELSYTVGTHSDTREVTLSGEAYFEVAHDPSRPFFVNSTTIKVHATGTAFNVSAYADEPEVHVTLVEGGVNIEDQTQVLASLTPNEQFSMDTASGKYSVRTVNPEVANAWKDGYFYFDDEPLGSIIRKLQRWYDVKIETSVPGLSDYRFSGRTKKYDSANNVLYMLELTREIQYEILDDSTIRIEPYR